MITAKIWKQPKCLSADEGETARRVGGTEATGERRPQAAWAALNGTRRPHPDESVAQAEPVIAWISAGRQGRVCSANGRLEGAARERGGGRGAQLSVRASAFCPRRA